MPTGCLGQMEAYDGDRSRSLWGAEAGLADCGRVVCSAIRSGLHLPPSPVFPSFLLSLVLIIIPSRNRNERHLIPAAIFLPVAVATVGLVEEKHVDGLAMTRVKQDELPGIVA